MVKTITLKEALAIMRTHQKFDIEVCTADGDRSIYTGAMLSTMPVMQSEAEASAPTGEARPTNEVNPMHAAHGTANIRLANGDIRKIYPALIECFNNKILII